MAGLVTILSGRGAHIKKECSHQFYFILDLRKWVGAKMKTMHVWEKRSVNSSRAFYLRLHKSGLCPKQKSVCMKNRSVNSLSVILQTEKWARQKNEEGACIKKVV